MKQEMASVERNLSKNTRSVSGLSPSEKNKKPDRGTDRAIVQQQVTLTRRQYQFYYYFIKKRLSQQSIAKRFNVTRQTVNEHAKKLEILGVIKPIDRKANPKFYKTTSIIPTTKFMEGKKGGTVISKNAKKPERWGGKPYKTVRDRKTGRFKGKRRGRGEGFHRDYDTLLSEGGRRIPMLRVHHLSFSCTILGGVDEEKIPWERKKGPNGMQQWVYRRVFPYRKSKIKVLREFQVTFVRQKTATYDELVIWLPEKYLTEYEVEEAERVLDAVVWTARKWFQNQFKVWLGLALPHSKLEIAREIDEPGLRRWVEENGMVRTRTKQGYAVVDQSKVGFPEKEFSSVDEVKADLHAAERILSLEEEMEVMVQAVKELVGKQRELIDSQKEFTESIREFMGLRRRIEKHLEEENAGMFR